MGSFGERLRREREMRGVSLDDIADATKIGTRLLRALEEEHFELLPGGIFNKGFVRAYAKYLGLSEDEMVADYLAAAGESAPDPRVIAEQNASRIDRADGDLGRSRMAGFPIIPVLILLVVIAAGAGGWHLYQERMLERQARLDAAKASEVPPPALTTTPGATPRENGSPTSNPAAGPPDTTNGTVAASRSLETNATTPGAASKETAPTASLSKTSPSVVPSGSLGANTPAAVGTTKTATPAGGNAELSQPGAAMQAAQPFEVAVRAKDRAWVSIKTDGKITVRGIINPPDVKTVRATDQVVFYTGNAGAVEISFNGQLIPLPGGPNSEGVLVFNSHGVVIPKPASASSPNQ